MQRWHKDDATTRRASGRAKEVGTRHVTQPIIDWWVAGWEVAGRSGRAHVSWVRGGGRCLVGRVTVLAAPPRFHVAEHRHRTALGYFHSQKGFSHDLFRNFEFKDLSQINDTSLVSYSLPFSHRLLEFRLIYLLLLLLLLRGPLWRFTTDYSVDDFRFFLLHFLVPILCHRPTHLPPTNSAISTPSPRILK